MPNRLIVPQGWPKSSGYEQAILADGRCLFLAGQIGWDVDRRLAVGLVAQVEQALLNVATLLDAASVRRADLVRLVWYLVDCRDYHAQRAEIGTVYRRIIGRSFLVMSVVEVCRLLEPGALVEIEATAMVDR